MTTREISFAACQLWHEPCFALEAQDVSTFVRAGARWLGAPLRAWTL